MIELVKNYLQIRKKRKRKVEFYKLSTIGSPIFPLPREMKRVARSLEGKVMILGDGIKIIKNSAKREGGRIEVFYKKDNGSITFKSSYGIFANFYPLLGYKVVEGIKNDRKL